VKENLFYVSDVMALINTVFVVESWNAAVSGARPMRQREGEVVVNDQISFVNPTYLRMMPNPPAHQNPFSSSVFLRGATFFPRKEF
jgi:hypothetical protein